MKRATALGMVAVVFFVGLAAGLLASRLVGRDQPQDRQRMHTPPFRGYFPSQDLDLTQEQQRRLEELFSRQREKWSQIHQDLQPQVESLMAETQNDLEQILTAEQLERYRARKERWQKRPRHRRPGEDGRRRRPGRSPQRDRDPPADSAAEPSEPPVD